MGRGHEVVRLWHAGEIRPGLKRLQHGLDRTMAGDSKYNARRKERYEMDPAYREQAREASRRYYEKKRAQRQAMIETGEAAPKQAGRPRREWPGESHQAGKSLTG